MIPVGDMVHCWDCLSNHYALWVKKKNKSGKQCMLMDYNGEHMTEREGERDAAKVAKTGIGCKVTFLSLI